MTGEHAPFSAFVAARRRTNTLIVQPRMGFSDPDVMRRGLLAVRAAGVPAVGTVTLDSFTRQGEHDRAALAREANVELNGYALVAMGAERTARMLDGIGGPGFPIQVRHGSPRPERIFRTMLAAGVEATEGGPVSYCLPYSRVPLRESVRAWSRAVGLLARQADRGVRCHLETFGGCMLGQLCPPSLLAAISVLECLFFAEHGITSMSASYAQQTCPEQDAEALGALRLLCAEYLPGVDWHVVLYTFMGLYPRSRDGANELLRQSARLAVRTGTERLIVKTVAEAHRIPTIAENVEALRLAHRTAEAEPSPTGPPADRDTEVYQQARILVDTVLGLAPSVAQALPIAFERGLLDVPYCLHPDNRNEARCLLGPDGRLEWCDTGRVPLPAATRRRGPAGFEALLADLEFHRRRLDPVPR
ncbi:methylaspartate mutase [Streptomyces sp. NBRC 14336]|uniref:methylaspartate mutase n=1 Tax=Streptomyces sp. NBRC 14336 TaxID=3030992 RepID=UPI0024A3695B|nr:methylaspartate mutase [Streptomyces sp. NBRC 14336]WBO75678.1 methylaspartate mutase [Streptomyces sp. SBE_14.2]GLW49518.1 methylaspartate mutase [Streptomyces sp. NBRC 14336]